MANYTLTNIDRCVDGTSTGCTRDDVSLRGWSASAIHHQDRLYHAGGETDGSDLEAFSRRRAQILPLSPVLAVHPPVDRGSQDGAGFAHITPIASLLSIWTWVGVQTADCQTPFCDHSFKKKVVTLMQSIILGPLNSLWIKRKVQKGTHVSQYNFKHDRSLHSFILYNSNLLKRIPFDTCLQYRYANRMKEIFIVFVLEQKGSKRRRVTFKSINSAK